MYVCEMIQYIDTRRRKSYEFPAENTWHTYRFLSADSTLEMEWWYPII